MLRTFKAGPYTRSLAYDPDGEYIAAVTADGTLHVWHISGKAELRLPKAAPKVRRVLRSLEHPKTPALAA